MSRRNNRSQKAGHLKNPGREELHPDECGYECVHCNLRKVDKVEIIDSDLGLFKIHQGGMHDPKNCDSCAEDHAVSTKRQPLINKNKAKDK
jgi:hypothetical protein